LNSCPVIISGWPFPQLPASCGHLRIAPTHWPTSSSAAGEAPRLIAYDDAVGLPLDQALAALEWTAQVGILAAEDLVHAARLGRIRLRSS